MKRGIDTNVLIYAHIPAFPEHSGVRSFLLELLGRPEEVLVLTPLVLHEFVHVVTDPKRFDQPLAMVDALAVADTYLGHANVECLPVTESAVQRAFGLLKRHRLGRRRIADALIAATLLDHRVQNLLTCNPGDFEVFGDLRLIDPRQA